MIVLKGRNVNGLWSKGLLALDTMGVLQDSRAGKVKVMPFPVLSVYERPQERVLMDAVRDANPMFHLMESLWMLSGRDDALFLNRYVGDFGKRFGDGPEEARYIHGAYGARWRRGLGFDQLDAVVEKLRKNPDDRQAVIQMWDGLRSHGPNERHDITYGSDDLTGDWKDRPCNTHVYLRVRTHDEAGLRPHGVERPDLPRQTPVLDLTVCCRSNDIVWGAYGANAVHFSVLQEYLAGRIGVGVGTMYQFSNNYHGYVDALRRQGDPLILSAVPDPYVDGTVSSIPVGKNWEEWDSDLARFMAWHDGPLWGQQRGRAYLVDKDGEFTNSWFAHTAVPLAEANWYWKNKYPEAALGRANSIDASDWRYATLAWMNRRIDK